MRVRVYGGAALAAYGFGQAHPFGCDRLAAFWGALKSQRIEQKVEIGAPVICTDDDLALFHTAPYIERVLRHAIGHRGRLPRLRRHAGICRRIRSGLHRGRLGARWNEPYP